MVSSSNSNQTDKLGMTVTDWRNGAGQGRDCQETTESYISNQAAKSDLNVFITETQDHARKQAAQSDERLKSGNARTLEGAVIAVKDNYCTDGIRTTAASKILDNFVPNYESTVTQKLWDAGAILIGKANLDEFAMGSSTEHSAYGPTINPVGKALGHDDYVPGGSSGGSAAAVAADLCMAALGSDTGGSIRQPASFCGVVGFKPTYGLCSRLGIIAYASSLDQAGVITKTVSDAALMMDVIAGHDAGDSTSINTAPLEFEKTLKAGTDGFTVGIPDDFKDLSDSDDLNALWQNMEKRIKDAGGTIKHVSLPSLKYALPAYYIIALSEASSNLARYDGVRYGHRAEGCTSIDELYEKTRAEGFGMEAKRRIMLGTYCLSAGYYDQYYNKARKIRTKINNEFHEAYKDVDFFAWPTTPSTAFKFGDHKGDPVSMYLEDVFTVPINLCGFPAINIPGFTASNGMPMGFQLIGPQLSDAKLMAVAHKIFTV